MEAGQALILLGHGSRDPAWRTSIDAIRERVRALEPELSIACAFLEFMDPTLEAAAASAVAAGARQVIIVPVFFGAGKHVRKDLPMKVGALSASHAGVKFSLDRALGDRPDVIEVAAQACIEALS